MLALLSDTCYHQRKVSGCCRAHLGRLAQRQLIAQQLLPAGKGRRDAVDGVGGVAHGAALLGQEPAARAGRVAPQASTEAVRWVANASHGMQLRQRTGGQRERFHFLAKALQYNQCTHVWITDWTQRNATSLEPHRRRLGRARLAHV